jgi:hypothetical protein
MNFSRRKINTIAPEYKRLLEIVFESLRELIEHHPFFFTLRHTPNPISKMIVATAIRTIGFTGASTANIENTNNKDLDFIIQQVYMLFVQVLIAAHESR